MFKNFDFENLHPSKKAAFADGFLTSLILATPVVVMYVKNLKDDRDSARQHIKILEGMLR